MRQQVNLFQPMFRREKKVFSALAMLQVLGVVVAALLVLYGYARTQLDGLQAQAALLQTQRAAAEARVEDLAKRYPPRRPSRLLAEEVQRLKKELAGKQRVVELLRSGSLGNTKGFSDYLVALAREHVEGTWLSDIAIGRGGQTVAIAGSTLTPQLVPVYLHKLGEEAAFAGRTFSSMDLRRAKDDPLRVDFELRTPGAKLSGGPGAKTK